MNVKELIAYLQTLPENTPITTFVEERAGYDTVVSTVPLTEEGIDYWEEITYNNKTYPATLHFGQR